MSEIIDFLAHCDGNIEFTLPSEKDGHRSGNISGQVI